MKIDSNAYKYGLMNAAKQSAKTLGAYAGGYTALRKVSDQMAIESYLDDHPNSKLSDKEILEIVRNVY